MIEWPHGSGHDSDNNTASSSSVVFGLSRAIKTTDTTRCKIKLQVPAISISCFILDTVSVHPLRLDIHGIAYILFIMRVFTIQRTFILLLSACIAYALLYLLSSYFSQSHFNLFDVVLDNETIDADLDPMDPGDHVIDGLHYPSSRRKHGTKRSVASWKTNTTEKQRIKFKVTSLIQGQNLEGIHIKLRHSKMKVRRPVKFNNRLMKLIFQLWDMKMMNSDSSTCQNLVSVDDKVYKYGKQLSRKLNRRFYDRINETQILDAISDGCEAIHNIFKYKTRRQYTRQELKDSYPIAYTVHCDRSAEQTLRMLYSIYHFDNVYCLQPNLKRGPLYLKVFEKLSRCLPNVVIPERMFGVGVRTHEKLKAELTCYQMLLQSRVKWKFGINLPSSAFPLRNNTFIVEYLKQKLYENELDWKTGNEKRFEKRTQFVHEVKAIKGVKYLVRTLHPKESPPGGITLFRKGENFIATREFYQFLTTSAISQELLDWSQDTKYPEGLFYASLHRYVGAPSGFPYTLYTSPAWEHANRSLTHPETRTGDFEVETENIVDNPESDLMATLWRSDRSHNCRGVYRGNLCVFGAADLRWLIAQDKLFATSFDYRIDRVVIDCLTRNLIRPILADSQVDTRTDIPMAFEVT